MALVLVSPPAVEPVTLAEAKLHLRVDHAEEDALISGQILAARVDCESATGLVFVQQTWDLVLDRFPCEIRPPIAPLLSVSAITYLDGDGVSRTLAGSSYRVDADSKPGRITPAHGTAWPGTYPVTGAVRVRFVAGFPDDGNSPPDLAANVPQPIKQAILLLVGHWYENRSEVVAEASHQPSSIPMGAQRLLSSYLMAGF